MSSYSLPIAGVTWLRGWRGLCLFLLGSWIVTATTLLLTACLALSEQEVSWSESLEAFIGLVQTLAEFRGDAWLSLALWTTPIVLLQGLFLLPIFRPIDVTHKPRSLWLSLLIAGFVASVASAGIGLVLFDILGGARGFVHNDGLSILIPAAVTLVPSWLVWGRFFWRLSQPCDPLLLDRMMLPLVAQSAMAVALTMPIDFALRRNRSCFCAAHSFFGLMMGLLALVWLLGPFLFLLINRRRRRSLRRTLCLACGHLKPPGKSTRCLECGVPTRRKG